MPTIVPVSDSTSFRQIRTPVLPKEPVNPIDPVWYLAGAVIIAAILFIIRSRNANSISEKPGLVVLPSAQPSIASIENITNEINQIAAGSYTTIHSAMV